jgi:hypothetical protein
MDTGIDVKYMSPYPIDLYPKYYGIGSVVLKFLMPTNAYRAKPNTRITISLLFSDDYLQIKITQYDLLNQLTNIERSMNGIPIDFKENVYTEWEYSLKGPQE